MSHSRSLSPVVMFLLLGSLIGTSAWGETVGSGLVTRRKKTEVAERDVVPADFREPRSLPRNTSPRNRVQRSTPRATLAAHEFGTMHRADRAPVTSQVRRASTYDATTEGEEIIDDADQPGFADVDSFGSCGPDGCDDGACDDVGGYGGGSLFGRMLTGAEYSTGVQAFSGPANRGGMGSAGFHEGINLGAPFFDNALGIGLQGGVMFAQSNLNGAQFTTDSRNQVFATLGAFRRSDWGFQYGLAVDYLHDDWYYKINLHQLRGELSWKLPDSGEFGFTFTNGLGTDTAVSTTFANGIPTNTTEKWVINDLYTFFVRRTFDNGFEGRLFAGFTGESDGLIGANLNTPIFDNWTLRTDLAYLLPPQGKFDNGFQQESWNMAVSLVWNPCNYNACGRNYYRPLFNVANNNSLMVDRR